MKNLLLAAFLLLGLATSCCCGGYHEDIGDVELVRPRCDDRYDIYDHD